VPGGPLLITLSRMGHLWDALAYAYRVLGFGVRRESERAAPVRSAIITAPSTRNPAETGSSPQLTMVGPVYGEYLSWANVCL
jgi:hypothetical protein